MRSTATICKVVQGWNSNSPSSGYMERLEWSAGRGLKVGMTTHTTPSVYFLATVVCEDFWIDSTSSADGITDLKNQFAGRPV